MQLDFDNYEHNYQPQVLSEMLQRKTLYQVSFHPNFLEVYLLIESKVISIITPHQIKKYFFQRRQKYKRVWSLHRRGFSTLMASNSRVTLTEMKKILRKHLRIQIRNQ